MSKEEFWIHFLVYAYIISLPGFSTRMTSIRVATSTSNGFLQVIIWWTYSQRHYNINILKIGTKDRHLPTQRSTMIISGRVVVFSFLRLCFVPLDFPSKILTRQYRFRIGHSKKSVVNICLYICIYTSCIK